APSYAGPAHLERRAGRAAPAPPARRKANRVKRGARSSGSALARHFTVSDIRPTKRSDRAHQKGRGQFVVQGLSASVEQSEPESTQEERKRHPRKKSADDGARRGWWKTARIHQANARHQAPKGATVEKDGERRRVGERDDHREDQSRKQGRLKRVGAGDPLVDPAETRCMCGCAGDRGSDP